MRSTALFTHSALRVTASETVSIAFRSCARCQPGLNKREPSTLSALHNYDELTLALHGSKPPKLTGKKKTNPRTGKNF
jgi:hypothetical protein